MLGAQDSNLEGIWVKASWVCQFPQRPSEPPPGAGPGPLPYRGKVTAVCDGTGASDGGRFRFTDQQAVSVLAPVLGVLGGSRTALSATSALRLLPNWATRTWSRHPVPTRAIRRTKAVPQPCAAA